MYSTIIVFVEPLAVAISNLIVPPCTRELHYITPYIGFFWCMVWCNGLYVLGFVRFFGTLGIHLLMLMGYQKRQRQRVVLQFVWVFLFVYQVKYPFSLEVVVGARC